MCLETEEECCSDSSPGYKGMEIVAQAGHKWPFDCSYQKYLNLKNQMNGLVGSLAAERIAIVVDPVNFEKQRMKAGENSRILKSGKKTMLLVEAPSLSYFLPLLLWG